MNWRVYPWLRQFALEWHAARGQGGDFQRPFSRDWEDLLEAADILTAEGRAEAFREAQELSAAKFLDLKTDRYRPYQIVGSSRVDLQACKLEYSIVSPK